MKEKMEEYNSHEPKEQEGQGNDEEEEVEVIENLDQLNPLAVLNVPDFIDRMNYRRCNCCRGVPYGDERYEKLPSIIAALPPMNGEQTIGVPIRVNTGNFIQRDHDSRANKLQLNKTIMDLGILHFLTANDIGQCLTINKSWSSYFRINSIDYQHMINVYPFITFQAQKGSCDAIAFSREVIYTAGDKGLHCYHAASGVQIKAYVFRDLTFVNKILLNEPTSLVTTYVNGEIKKWNLCFDVSALRMSAALSGHSRAITDSVMSIPTEFHCPSHSIEKHQCYLYTVSDDRTVCIWDNDKDKKLRSLKTYLPYGPALCSIAVSLRHLFVSSSRGDVVVFNLNKKCERKDRHNCSDPLIGHQPFCEQLNFKYEMAPIRAMQVCGNLRRPHSILVLGNEEGDVASYRLPEVGLNVERTYHRKQVHPKGVTIITAFSGRLDEKSKELYNSCALNKTSFVHQYQNISIDSFQYLAIGGNDCTVTLWKIGETKIHILRRLRVISRVKGIITVPILESRCPEVALKKAEWAAAEEKRKAALDARLAEEAKKAALRSGKKFPPPPIDKDIPGEDLAEGEEEKEDSTSSPSKRAEEAKAREKPEVELHVQYLYIALANGQVQSYGLGFT